jgi:hypothetical protein
VGALEAPRGWRDGWSTRGEEEDGEERSGEEGAGHAAAIAGLRSGGGEGGSTRVEEGGGSLH